MAATKLIVRVIHIYVNDREAGNEWRFKTQVRRLPSGKTESFGDPGKQFETKYGRLLTQDFWSVPLTLAPDDKQLEISVSGEEKGFLFWSDIGKVLAVLNVPIFHGYLLSLTSSGKGLFSALLEVQITQDSEKKPGEVTTIVSRQGRTSYNTIHDGMQSRLVHICPVIPVPWATGIPDVPVGVSKLSGSDPETLRITAGAKKLNALVNPAVIPAISVTDPKFQDMCARIRITGYRPKDLDKKKLIWKAATGNIRFFDGSGGKVEVKGVDSIEVKAYGVLAGKEDEEGRIEVRWDEPGTPLLAVYRAIVGKPRYLHYRANIIKCSKEKIDGITIQNPTVLPEDIVKRFEYNSILMWQSGILLLPDPDDKGYNGAKVCPGFEGKAIFEVKRDENQTFNRNANFPDSKFYSTILNQRSGILNICYIHSHLASKNYSGYARDRRLSAASKTEKLKGSPSTSWVFPTGIYPDADGQEIGMETMGPSDKRADEQKAVAGDGNLDTICGLTIVDWAANISNANTESHEIGHVLGLVHRGSGGYDDITTMKPSADKVNHLAGANKGKGHPWDENIMSYSGYDLAQDFDMIQSIVIRRHALLQYAPLPPKASPPPPPPPKPAPPPPPPPPAPPEKKPVPAEWLPTTEDKTLLQEYLTGKRAGLRNKGYDIGTSGPDGDGVDGVIGPKTKAGIRGFQRDHGGLVIDGVYGPKTKAAFEDELNGA